MSPPHPTAEKLETLLLGGLPPDEAAEAAAHVETCDECTITLSGLASDRAHVRRGGRERRLVPGTATPKPVKPWFWIIMAVAVLLGGFIALRSQREPTLIELAPPGVAPPTVRAFARASGELVALTEASARLAAGDKVRLAVDGAREQHLLVFLIDSEGAFKTLWPKAAAGGAVAAVSSRRFEARDRGFLPGDIELAPPARALRIFALFSGGVIHAKEVVAATKETLAKSGGLASLLKLEVPSTYTFTLYVERR